MTFSIVARDKVTGDLGIAVQSKFPAVGSLVPWISLDAGAIATQALANISYGTRGLQLLRSGLTASEVLQTVLSLDPESSQRQVGIIDKFGNVVAHTGSDCYEWAGHIVNEEEQVTCQGNILIEGTIESMMDAYLNTQGDLAERLMSALEAGQQAGGDSRGQQSANLLVYREKGGYGGGSDVYIDVRVDDHPDAVAELRRIFELYSLTLLEREDPEEITRLSGETLQEIGEVLIKLGYIEEIDLEEDDAILEGLDQWIHTENFENKIRDDNYIWNSVLDYLINSV